MSHHQHVLELVSTAYAPAGAGSAQLVRNELTEDEVLQQTAATSSPKAVADDISSFLHDIADQTIQLSATAPFLSTAVDRAALLCLQIILALDKPTLQPSDLLTLLPVLPSDLYEMLMVRLMRRYGITSLHVSLALEKDCNAGVGDAVQKWATVIPTYWPHLELHLGQDVCVAVNAIEGCITAITTAASTHVADPLLRNAAFLAQSLRQWADSITS